SVLYPGLPPVGAVGDDLPDLRQWKARAEEAYVRSVWSASNGDARKAAGMAGVSRGHWYELMKKHGL
ncbi:sigma-54-dependent Fis family transcriptional regulator, partial [Desulfovibrio sp. 1188_IL3213]